VDVTQVRRYIGTLAPSEKTRSCKSCARSLSTTANRGALWLAWMAGRGKRVGEDLEGMVCAGGPPRLETEGQEILGLDWPPSSETALPSVYRRLR
jgi:hypothetical protein